MGSEAPRAVAQEGVSARRKVVAMSRTHVDRRTCDASLDQGMLPLWETQNPWAGYTFFKEY